MYRTKAFNQLYEWFLKPIMDFVGITPVTDDECGLLKVVGADVIKNGKSEPTYFANPFNEDKIYTIVRSQDEFLNYRSRREKLEYFNPFVKKKNTLLLLLMCTPIIYEKVVKCVEDDEDDIASVIADDSLEMISQDTIADVVKIKQYPLVKNEENESVYKYTITIKDDEEFHIESESTNKIVAMLMLIIKTIVYFDEYLEVVNNCDGDIQTVEDCLVDLLEKYAKERQLNSKDIKKTKIETVVDLTENMDDLLDVDNEDDIGSMLSEDDAIAKDQTDGTIDISKTCHNVIPTFMTKFDDDDIINLDLS